MRFTATTAFAVYAKGIAKYLEWRCYARKTSTINTAPGSGSWTEVTDYVTEIPDFSTALEFELGQFRADVITISGRNIAWWMANVLNPGAGERVEVKWTCQIGLGASKLATDVIYAFVGWVKMDSIMPTNFNDSVTFEVFSAEAIGQDYPGEVISTQYVETDVEGDGTGTDGLILDKINSLYLTDANIGSYVLHAGLHTIFYDYGGGTPVARLDDGADVTLSAGANTLANGDGDQKVTVYVRSVNDLPAVEGLFQEIVVVTAGDTLPRQWYRRVAARSLLKTLYAQLGIDTVTFDTLEMPTADGSTKVSFLDQPPGNISVTGQKWAMATDGTDLFVGVGNKVYKRTMSTGAYTLLATLSAGYDVIKLLYNARNGHLWIVTAEKDPIAVEFAFETFRYIISTASLSSAVVFPSWVGDDGDALEAAAACVQVYDYEYTAGSFTYGLIATDASGINFLDESSMTASIVITPSIPSGAPFVGMAYVVTDTYNFTALVPGTPDTYFIYAVSVDGAGAWSDDSVVAALDGYPKLGVYDPDETAVYYLDALINKVVKETTGVGSATAVITLASGEEVFEISRQNDVNYTSTTLGKFYTLESGAATLISSTPPITTRYNALTYVSGRLYGLDLVGRLFQRHTSLAFYVETGRYEGKDVQQALIDTLNAFMLVGTVSTVKEGRIYRRGDDDGDATTSGNTLTLTTDEIADFSKSLYAYKAFDYVQVSNGTVTHSYNGTSYDEDLTIAGRKLQIHNELIPDEIVQDMAYWLYQYFSQDRHLYTVEVDRVPLFNYEPFDGFSATLTDQYLAESIAGVIVGQTLRANGTMQLLVAAPL